MTDISKIIGAVASALHLDADELTAALKDGENWLADDVIGTKVQETIIAQVKAAKDEQLKRGTRESWKSVERWLKNEGFTPEGDVKGLDLLIAYNEWKAEQQQTPPDGTKPAELSKEELAKLQTVKQLIAEGKVEAGKKYGELQAEFETYKQTQQKQRVSEVAKSRLYEYLEEAKVLLEVPGSPVNKQQRIEAVSNFLNLSQIGLNDKGEPVFLDKDGQPEVDDFGKPKDFKKFVVGIGEGLYGIQKQDPTRGGGNPNPNGKTGTEGGEYVPKYIFASEAEYNKKLLSEADPKESLEIQKSYRHQQQQAAG